MSDNYIIEFKQFGNLLKVSAIDPATLQEVSIVLPACKKLSRADMGKMAVRRLEYVLNKRNEDIT